MSWRVGDGRRIRDLLLFLSRQLIGRLGAWRTGRRQLQVAANVLSTSLLLNFRLQQGQAPIFYVEEPAVGELERHSRPLPPRVPYG